MDQCDLADTLRLPFPEPETEASLVAQLVKNLPTMHKIAV